MSAAEPTSIISHWNHMVTNMHQSSDAFYASVSRNLQDQGLADTTVERVNLSEGGIFSSKREYLQVRRKEHVFHVCAAPFGTGFFISWWLGEIESGLVAWLSSLPLVGWVFGALRNLVKPLTYYRIDTALMFQSVTHGAVLAALDNILEAKGQRGIAEAERTPIMRDFWDKL